MRLEIRRATPDDAERLSAIARAAKASWGYPAAWLSIWEPNLRVTPAYVQAALVCAAIVDGKPAGFYALERRDDRWWLEHLWVEPRRHGCGIGRRLFEHALRSARTIRPGVVSIESDPHAAGFYARMGAREIGSVAAPVAGDPDRRLPIFEMSAHAG